MVFDFKLSAEEIASIDELDKEESGRSGPNPDTYEGIRPASNSLARRPQLLAAGLPAGSRATRASPLS
jgi:hypothetical protein